MSTQLDKKLTSFTVKVERFEGKGTWTYASVPPEVSKQFKKKGRIRIKVTIKGNLVEAAMMPDGDGSHFIILNKEVREKTAIKIGDTIEISIQEDSHPTPTTTPPDVLAALQKNKEALSNFEKLAPSHQKEYLKWIEEAKKDETRKGRVAKALEMLALGKKLK